MESEEEPTEDRFASVLATPLSELDFPARMLHFFDRRGLCTLRELVAIEPASLLVERNLGRKSVSDTAKVIQRHLGTTWEEARRESGFARSLGTIGTGGSATPNSDPAEHPPPPNDWDRLREGLSASARARTLTSIGLPVRVESFAMARGLRTVGDLLGLSLDDISEARGIGRVAVASILRTLAALEDPDASKIPGSNWIGLFRGALRSLPERERLVLGRRSGLAGPAPTLAEMGESLGLSRERIRQIEVRGVERIRNSTWVPSVRRRLETHLTRSVHDLIEVETDPLFEGAVDASEAFIFLTNSILDGALQAVSVEGIQVLTRLDPERLTTRLRHARDIGPRLTFPFAWADRYESLATALGCSLYDASDLNLFLDREWIEEAGRAIGFGSRKTDEVIAFVRAAPGPVHYTELVQRFGRRKTPDELVLLGPGLLTTPERIPDWDRWVRRLPPLVRSIIEREGPHRQWTTSELLPFLLEEAELPEWCNEHALGSLLRNAKEVEYLNRNVVALPDSGQDRLYVHDALLHLLERAERPMDEDSARNEMRAQRGFADTTWTMLCHRTPFLLLDGGTIGLSPRDVPGGQDAIATVTRRLFDALDARQQGLPATQLRGALSELGEPFNRWDLRLLRSVLRHDGRFRSAPGGAVGLSEWDSVRAPAQAEVLSELLDQNSGSVLLEEAAAAIPTASGEPLSRGRIGLVANSIRARLIGDRVEWMPEGPSSSPPLHSLVADFLRDVPEKTVPLLRRLLELPLPRAELRTRLGEWSKTFRREAKHNPAVEEDQVERLIRLGKAILAHHWRDASRDQVEVASAALVYLTTIDDADTDTSVGGLDDDEAVLELAARIIRTDGGGPGQAPR